MLKEVNHAMYPLWKLHKEHVVEFGSVDNMGDNQFRYMYLHV